MKYPVSYLVFTGQSSKPSKGQFDYTIIAKIFIHFSISYLVIKANSFGMGFRVFDDSESHDWSHLPCQHHILLSIHLLHL